MKRVLFIFILVGILSLATFQLARAAALGTEGVPPTLPPSPSGEICGNHVDVSDGCNYSVLAIPVGFPENGQAYRGHFSADFFGTAGWFGPGSAVVVGCLSETPTIWTGACYYIVNRDLRNSAYSLPDTTFDINGTAMQTPNDTNNKYKYWFVRVSGDESYAYNIKYTVESRLVAITNFSSDKYTVSPGEQFTVSWNTKDATTFPQISWGGDITAPVAGFQPIDPNTLGSKTFTAGSVAGTAQISIENVAGYSGYGLLSLPKRDILVNVVVPQATVACVVTRADNAAAIAGATCNIAGQSGTTDGNGYRAFGGIVLGSQTMTVTAPGYSDFTETKNITGNYDWPVALVSGGGGGTPAGTLAADSCYTAPCTINVHYSVSNTTSIEIFKDGNLAYGPINPNPVVDPVPDSGVTGAHTYVLKARDANGVYQQLATATATAYTAVPPATHLSCVSNACTRVSGTGSDTCTPEGSICPPPVGTGTVQINSNNQSAANQTTFPNGTVNGWNGSHTWLEAPTGTYSVTADPVAGYTVSVVPSSQTLGAGQGITFTITYTANGQSTITCNGQSGTCNLTPGQSATIAWDGRPWGATNCNVLPYDPAQGWTGVTGTKTDPTPATRTVQLDCWKPGTESVVASVQINVSSTPGPTGSGSSTASCTVAVQARPAPSVVITADQSTLSWNNSGTTLNWSSGNADSCSASGNWSGAKALSGPQGTGALVPGTYNYTLTCYGNGSAQSTATVAVNAPTPNTPTNVTATEPNYCVSGPAVTIGWTYSDPSGSPQSAYQVQITDTGNFNNPILDTGKLISGSNSYFTGQGVLQFNTTYKARVRYWNSYDVVSAWSNASNTWKTPLYAYPQTDFSWTANGILNNPSPPLKKPVQFNDATVFGGNPNGRQWSWLFGDSGTSTIQNPSHTYVAEGSYYVTLTATDNANQVCAKTKGPLIIQKPIPQWREIAPR